MLIFCKTTLKSKISKLYTTRIKQGIAGKIGNKGATIVRFNLDNSSIAIVCAHLESGQKRVHDRVSQFKSIVRSREKIFSMPRNFKTRVRRSASFIFKDIDESVS